jgi:hypothetical protein
MLPRGDRIVRDHPNYRAQLRANVRQARGSPRTRNLIATRLGHAPQRRRPHHHCNGMISPPATALKEREQGWPAPAQRSSGINKGPGEPGPSFHGIDCRSQTTSPPPPCTSCRADLLISNRGLPFPPTHGKRRSLPTARRPLDHHHELRRAAIESWRRREEFQSLCLTHTLRQPLRFGQLPNQQSLETSVPASAPIYALQQIAKTGERHQLVWPHSGGSRITFVTPEK